ncbi:MAG: hypothetical protein L0216_03080, partial [Planctomycetales bacterium]|nr:hypothetical protein [Planctomycetales bacterium]
MKRFPAGALVFAALTPIGCGSAPVTETGPAGGTRAVSEPASQTSTVTRTNNPGPSATGITNPGGKVRPGRSRMPGVGFPVPAPSPESKARRKLWPWEDRSLSLWERHLAVHRLEWLAPPPAGESAESADEPKGTPAARWPSASDEATL